MLLDYIIWDIDPIIFKIGSVRVGWYGLLLAGGFLAAGLIMQKIVKNEKANTDLMDKFMIFTIVWTIVGLRLGHCLFYDWAYYKDHILEIFIPFAQEGGSWTFTGFEGLASHGGTTGIILFVLYFSKKHKISLLWLFDRLAIVIPLAAALVRCGNLMNSEIIGTATTMSWGFVFTRLGENEPRHPAQMYEALVYFSLFAYQMWYYFKQTKGHIPGGRSVGTLLVVIFTARFFIEFIKENQVSFEESLSLNMGQWLSIPFILLGIVFLYYSFTKKMYPKATYSKKN